MRAPNPSGTPITLERRQLWIRQFAAYRHTVDMASVSDWLDQFKSDHRDVAARVLDAVDFVSLERVSAFYRTGLKSLQGWHADPTQRQGRWRFCPWSTSAGESGDSMLHNFRVANGLATRPNNELFIHPSDILKAGLGADDSLVFVNDFIGTGTEVCDAWNEMFAELTAGIGSVYLLVALTHREGRARVCADTDVQVVFGQELTDADNLFDPACAHFSAAEKAAILKYACLADKKRPKGFGDLGLVVVFQHRCPNNSIAILHAQSRKWTPLFPRHD